MNFYEILGVARDADKKTIGKAYRKLAKQWHPDLNPDKRELAEKKMAEINEAYATLSNDVGRIDYDKKLAAEAARAKGGRTSAGPGTAGRKPPPGSQPRRARTPGADASNVDFNNIHSNFASFFGFDPKTKEVTNEDKLNTYAQDRKKKNPLDTTAAFESFFGFKR